MGHLSPPSGREVALNNWTLVFSNPHLEQEFRAHQTRVWGSMQIWRLKMNLLAGLINLSITSYFLSLVRGQSHNGSHSPAHSSRALPTCAQQQPMCVLTTATNLCATGQHLHQAGLPHPVPVVFPVHDCRHHTLLPGQAAAAQAVHIQPDQPPGRGELQTAARRRQQTAAGQQPPVPY